MDLREDFTAIMEGTTKDPPGVSLGQLAWALRRSGQHISVGALIGERSPKEWRALALAVVHLALGRIEDPPPEPPEDAGAEEPPF